MKGRSLSHYKILEQIGEGGMGVVYRAEDLQRPRQVALKVLQPEKVGGEAAIERLRREARACVSLPLRAFRPDAQARRAPPPGRRHRWSPATCGPGAGGTGRTSGIQFLRSDHYRGSLSVVEAIGSLPGPVSVSSNFGASISYLLESIHTKEVIVDYEFLDWKTGSENSPVANRVNCVALMREGGYLTARLEYLLQRENGPTNPDVALDRTLRDITTAYSERGWHSTLSAASSGRVSYRLECFAAGS